MERSATKLFILDSSPSWMFPGVPTTPLNSVNRILVTLTHVNESLIFTLCKEKPEKTSQSSVNLTLYTLLLTLLEIIILVSVSDIGKKDSL